MSEETSKELTAEEIRLRERRSFDAFNEEAAQRRQVRRDSKGLQDAEENKRWVTQPNSSATEESGIVVENASHAVDDAHPR